MTKKKNSHNAQHQQCAASPPNPTPTAQAHALKTPAEPAQPTLPILPLKDQTSLTPSEVASPKSQRESKATREKAAGGSAANSPAPVKKGEASAANSPVPVKKGEAADANVATKHNALVKEIQTIVPATNPSEAKARKEVAKNKKGVVTEVQKKGVVNEVKQRGAAQQEDEKEREQKHAVVSARPSTSTDAHVSARSSTATGQKEAHGSARSSTVVSQKDAPVSAHPSTVTNQKHAHASARSSTVTSQEDAQVSARPSVTGQKDVHVPARSSTVTAQKDNHASARSSTTTHTNRPSTTTASTRAEDHTSNKFNTLNNTPSRDSVSAPRSGAKSPISFSPTPSRAFSSTATAPALLKNASSKDQLGQNRASTPSSPSPTRLSPLAAAFGPNTAEKSGKVGKGTTRSVRCTAVWDEAESSHGELSSIVAAISAAGVDWHLAVAGAGQIGMGVDIDVQHFGFSRDSTSSSSRPSTQARDSTSTSLQQRQTSLESLGSDWCLVGSKEQEHEQEKVKQGQWEASTSAARVKEMVQKKTSEKVEEVGKAGHDDTLVKGAVMGAAVVGGLAIAVGVVRALWH
ncbi:hypothetical protein HDV00_007282 [Rhizophlyctis rosea]|nr:hypothetical protein HDV00_007282 [Rhizophlyctis rosea]